jgi:AmiR/NasT family two-component response regulator
VPADVFLTERLAQLQPDLIIVDAESGVRDALKHEQTLRQELTLARSEVKEVSAEL